MHSNSTLSQSANLPRSIRLSATAVGIRVSALAVALFALPQLSMTADTQPTGLNQTAATARPATKVSVISCEPIPNAGRTVTTSIVDFPAGAYSPAHRHPGSVTVLVLEGRIRSQLSGEPAAVFGPGQTWFEPPGVVHAFAENVSDTATAKLLAVFVTDANCGPLVTPAT